MEFVLLYRFEHEECGVYLELALRKFEQQQQSEWRMLVVEMPPRGNKLRLNRQWIPG